MQTIHAGGDLAGGLGPDEGFGIIVVLGDVAVDGGLEVDDRMEAAAPEPATAKGREERLDGIQPRARGWGEVEGPAGMAGKPFEHLGMLVGAVIVEDGVDHLAGRHRALDGIQKTDEILVPVALHAAADHRALEHVERGEQRGRAVALVVVRHGPGLARLQRQARLGPVQGLDLRFFVDRKDDRVLGRGHVQADDVLELGGKLGVARALEGADAMRLQLMARPDPLDRSQGDAGRLGHGAAGPMCGLARRFAAGQRHDAMDGRVAQMGSARPARRVPQQALDAGCGEPPLPAPHRRPANPAAPRRLGDVQPRGRGEDDPSPRHVLLGAVAIGHDRLQTSTIGSRDQRTYDLSHAPSMAQRLIHVNL